MLTQITTFYTIFAEIFGKSATFCKYAPKESQTSRIVISGTFGKLANLQLAVYVHIIGKLAEMGAEKNTLM